MGRSLWNVAGSLGFAGSTAAWASPPGCSFRRRLCFRYTLRWDQPLAPATIDRTAMT